jgi:response regulator RpfG family c-di-GMP phosphodiesterase
MTGVGLPKVLYVDDEYINLDLLRLTFLNEFDIITAESGTEGLKILESDPEIRVIISDLKMPGMSGLEFIKEIKKQYPSKVCMLLTAFMESEVMMEGFNKELLFRYLMKPFRKDELKKYILEALKR